MLTIVQISSISTKQTKALAIIVKGMAGVTWAGRMDPGVAGAVDRNHVVAAAKYRGYKDDVTHTKISLLAFSGATRGLIALRSVHTKYHKPIWLVSWRTAVEGVASWRRVITRFTRSAAISKLITHCIFYVLQAAR